MLEDEKGSVVKGLYAAGECACVSIHGANRLGCNSLLDLIVFGRRSGIAMKRDIAKYDHRPIPGDPLKFVESRMARLWEAKGQEKMGSLRQKMQSLMMEYGSVFRNEEGLKQGIEGIRTPKERYEKAGVADKGKVFNYALREAIELGHQLDLAELILTSALHRKESRGAHFHKSLQSGPGQSES